MGECDSAKSVLWARIDAAESLQQSTVLHADSVRRKRKRKMNKHKHRKRLKKMRHTTK